jgi:protease I
MLPLATPAAADTLRIDSNLPRSTNMANKDLSNVRIAVIATDGFEQIELTEPVEALEDANATVHVIAPEPGRIRAWNETDWGEQVPVDRTIDEANPNEYDALILKPHK